MITKRQPNTKGVSHQALRVLRLRPPKLFPGPEATRSTTTYCTYRPACIYVSITINHKPHTDASLNKQNMHTRAVAHAIWVMGVWGSVFVDAVKYEFA